MGKVLKFRRKRWTRANDYARHGSRHGFTVRGFLRDLWYWLKWIRPFVLAGILGVTWVHQDPLLMEPPAFLSTDPEPITTHFTRCGPGRGYACVIDGDTFKLGDRKIRMIGIDAPETHPARCPEEARLGELATGKLQTLLNAGPIELVAPSYGEKDSYGRDLRVVRLMNANGSTTSIAGEMRDSGLARRYAGGFKRSWC